MLEKPHRFATFYTYSRGIRWPGLCALITALFVAHLLAIMALPQVVASRKAPVKVTLVKLKKRVKFQDQKKQLVEVLQEETLKPKEADFLGQVDHQTAKETKVRKPRQNDQDPVNTPLEQLSQTLKQAESARPPGQSRPIESQNRGRAKRYLDQGTYAKLLPRLKELSVHGVGKNSHQDAIDKDLPESEIIDVNTTEFKWLGYFTNVRKMVAQTFFSPHAKLGRTAAIKEKLQLYGKAKMKGRAIVALTITRSGLLTSAEIVSSSGDKDIDVFWQRVLQLAAPYPPLPKHYPEDELTFTYALQYDYEWRRESARLNLSPRNYPNPY